MRKPCKRIIVDGVRQSVQLRGALKGLALFQILCQTCFVCKFSYSCISKLSVQDYA
jgi:hypothetical protein